MNDPGSAPGLGPAELQEALASSDPATRAAGIRRARPDRANTPLLLGSLRDGDVEVRRSAIRALGRIPHPAATTALLQASSDDPSVAVRAEAVAAVGRILVARVGPAPSAEGGPEPGRSPDL